MTEQELRSFIGLLKQRADEFMADPSDENPTSQLLQQAAAELSKLLPPKERDDAQLLSDIAKAYAQILPSLHPLKEELTASEIASIRARIAGQKKVRGNLEWWRAYFTQVSGSEFLMGKTTDWRANFTWLIGPRNMSKVLAGNYGGGRSRQAVAQDDFLEGVQYESSKRSNR